MSRSRDTTAGRRTAAVVVAVATVVIAVPLASRRARVAQDTRIEYAIRSKADSVLAGTGVQLAAVDARGSTVDVTLEGPPVKGVAVARMVAQRIHAARPDLTVKVSLLQSEIVQIPGR